MKENPLGKYNDQVPPYGDTLRPGSQCFKIIPTIEDHVDFNNRAQNNKPYKLYTYNEFLEKKDVFSPNGLKHKDSKD